MSCTRRKPSRRTATDLAREHRIPRHACGVDFAGWRLPAKHCARTANTRQAGGWIKLRAKPRHHLPSRSSEWCAAGTISLSTAVVWVISGDTLTSSNRTAKSRESSSIKKSNPSHSKPFYGTPPTM